MTMPKTSVPTIDFNPLINRQQTELPPKASKLLAALIGAHLKSNPANADVDKISKKLIYEIDNEEKTQVKTSHSLIKYAETGRQAKYYMIPIFMKAV